MRKLFLLFFAVFVCLVQSNLYAQNGPGTPSFFNAPTTSTSGNAFPLNSTASNKVQWIYGPGTFTTDGTATGSPVGAGNNITKIFIRMSTTFNASTTYSPNFEISFKQTGTHNKHPDGTFITGMTSVYQSSAFQFTGITANTWYGITLQTPFTYDPSQNLIVEIKSNLASAGGNTIVGIASTGNERIYGAYAATSGTAGTILAYMGLDVTPNGPCTSPPTAGIASASVSNGCSGVPFNLNITGYSTGSGQTYQWDSSANGTTWFPMPGDTTPSVIQKQVSSSYYRCRVTCSGITANSSPTSLIVTPALVSGNFTINSGIATGSNNFQNFADAISYISCGINGPVKFTVIPGTGPYVGQLTVPAIPGASGVNRITVKGNNETIQFTAPDATNRTAITLNGADFITLDSLNIDVSAGASSGWGIVLMNGADSNIIRNCTIVNNLLATTTNYSGIIINGSNTTTATSGNNGNGNIIENNFINGGYYSVYVYGSTTPYNKGNVFRGNQLKDFYGYGIYVYGNDSLSVSKNEIIRPTRTNSTTCYGIYAGTCTNFLIEKNRIHNLWDAIATSTSATYPIYIASSGISAVAPNKIENNLLYSCSNSGGTIYGIYSPSYNFNNYYHNTVVIDEASSTAGTTYGMYAYGASGVNIKNNIVHVGRGGTGTKYCIYFGTTAPASCNNNVLYITSTGGTINSIAYLTTGYATLPLWQASNSNLYDQQSLSLDPLYTSPPTGDFTPSDFSIYTAGVNVGVTKDINDSTRIAYNPGAFRMVAPGCSGTPIAGTISVTSTNVCANTNFSLNLSGNSIGTGLTFTWERSKNGTTAWTAISSALTSPSFTTQQDTSYFYRCKVQCNSGTPVNSNVVQITSPALVNGTFTINSAILTGGTNFQTFAEAINSVSCGINGPVTFNVAIGSGPYTEQITIPEIIGASFTNKVTINGNGETLTFAGTTGIPYTLGLNGADYLVVKKLVVTGTDATNSLTCHLWNGADNNTFDSCTFNSSTTATGTLHSAFSLSGTAISATATGNSGSNNIVRNCNIIGGYYCFVFTGSVANVGNQALKNTITEFYTYGAYLAYCQNTLFKGNTIERPTRTNPSSGYGVYLTTSSANCVIDGNTVRNLFGGLPTSTSAAYCLYNAVSATAGNENVWSNNLVYNINNGGGTIYGIYVPTYNYIKIYHNTISIDDPSATAGTTYGIYCNGTGVDFKNNISYVTRGGTGTKYCIYHSGTTVTSDNNIFYMNAPAGTNYIGYQTTAYTSLALYQQGTNKDSSSYSIDPQFANPGAGNFKPTESTVDNKGKALGILKDILDSTRSTSTPDIGAYEFSTITAGLNFGATALVSPIVNTNGCYTNTENVTIKIRNSSSATHNFATNPVTVNVNITGAVTINLSKVVNTGTLQSDSTLNVSITTPLNMTTVGTYTFNASTSLTGDVNPSNDAMVAVNRTKTSLNAGNPSSNPTAYCITGGAPTLTAAGSSGFNSLQWQESNNSGGVFTNIAGATNSPYTLSSAINQTKYFKLKAFCGSDSSNSPELVVILNNPQVLTKTDSSRCGTGTVVLKATGSNGTTLNWFTSSTGGTSLGTGSPFTTPSISANTTFYVGASIAGSGSASPLLITEIDLGTNDRLEIQNVSGAPFDATGWKVALSNSYTDINSVNANIQTLSGVIAAGEIKSWTDAAAGPNYWGSNILWNPGAYPTFTGWAMILDNNNVIKDVVFLNWPSANIQSSNIVIGTTLSIGTNWSGNGVDQTTVAGTQSISRKGSFDNNDLNDFEIVNLSFDALNPNMSLPFGGFSCDGPRTAVTATVNANPAAVAVTPNSATQCTNSPAQKLTATGGVGAGTYAWTPTTGLYTDAAATTAYTGGGKDSVFARPGSTTKYTATSTNTNNCSSIDTSNIIVNCTLPVSYLNFAGVREAGNNVLRWTTSTEQNNKGFDVERSVDGKTFSSLGFVASKAANGNSNNELSYNFIDNQLTASVYYYRLRQVDLNGEVKYSNTIVIKGDRVNTIKMSGLYPNPTTEEVTITIDAPNAEKVVLVVTDIYGKQIIQQNISVEVGSNNTKLKVGSLSSGTYLIKLQSSKTNTSSVLKFVKQ